MNLIKRFLVWREAQFIEYWGGLLRDKFVSGFFGDMFKGMDMPYTDEQSIYLEFRRPLWKR